MTQHPARDVAQVIAARLAHPCAVPSGQRTQAWWRQSLAHGVPGIALLHIELAAAGMEPWQRVHDWLATAASASVTCGPDSHPFYGAPALAHAMACAAAQHPGSYQRALNILDRQIIIDVRRRLAAAHDRIARGRLPALAEFDALRGLTGYGAYLLRNTGSDTVRALLDYLVRLAVPVTSREEQLPGWWTLSGPSGRADRRFDGGHANNGLAHGVAVISCVKSFSQVEAMSVVKSREARWS